jgi:hypothetical protein
MGLSGFFRLGGGRLRECGVSRSTCSHVVSVPVCSRARVARGTSRVEARRVRRLALSPSFSSSSHSPLSKLLFPPYFHSWYVHSRPSTPELTSSDQPRRDRAQAAGPLPLCKLCSLKLSTPAWLASLCCPSGSLSPLLVSHLSPRPSRPRPTASACSSAAVPSKEVVNLATKLARSTALPARPTPRTRRRTSLLSTTLP